MRRPRVSGDTLSSPGPPIITQDDKYPGVQFLGTRPLKETVSSEGQEIFWDDIGIAFSIPSGAVPDGESMKLTVQPCMTGPFQPPAEVELVSPSYHISKSGEFIKDIEVVVYHSVNLMSDEDCEQMTFLSAPGTPERGDKYKFKPITGGVFRKNESFGTIRLKHFCHVTVGSWIRRSTLRRSKKLPGWFN